MPDPVFFRRAITPTIAEVAAIAGATLPEGADGMFALEGAAPLERAGPADLAYMDNPRYGEMLASTRAAACLVSKRFAPRVPATTVALVAREPYRAFATVLGRMYPTAARPLSSFDAAGISPGAYVHPAARLEGGVIVDPGAVIGPGAEIGAGTVIGANAVIGPDTRIGRDCSIGANASVHNALIGNRVIVHCGARIGQDGFGFAMGSQGHLKVPQIGRVIIQDDVEIGANSTIDRGASRDTVIGEGTKIDNLVQIGHNVVVGRHCVIVAQVGISGSTTLEDHVVLAGQAGVTGHVRIGAGAQVAGASSVAHDIPPGERWGGTPARPIKAWMREFMALKRLAAQGSPDKASPDPTGE
jgi:UDP-3-O-[3-hydroxymyristoyl] glucosamine N-acyltransferase